MVKNHAGLPIASACGEWQLVLCLNRVQDGWTSNFPATKTATSFRQGAVWGFILRPPLRDTIFIAIGTGIALFRSTHWLLADSARYLENSLAGVWESD
jgi:hypothetical protein